MMHDFFMISGMGLDWTIQTDRPLTSKPLNEATTINSHRHIADMLRPIAFTRVLNAVANERAKYAAVMTHRFFTADHLFLRIVNQQIMCSTELPWGLVNETTEQSLNNSRASNHTSDYHSSSSNASESILNVSSRLKAPDLTNLQSPLLDFARREEEFASKFLQIVVHSTSLLKRPTHVGLRTSSRRRTPRSSKRRHHELTVENELEEVGADPKRKSVSWSDATDTSLQQQFVHRYLDQLWSHLSTHLWDFLHEPLWGGPVITDQQLGALSCSVRTTPILLARSMLLVCAKGE